ncbi:BRO family protein [Lachnospiraceae bacterium 46-61]
MQQVMLFENQEFGQFRMIFIKGKEYFVANDIAKALGYSVPKDAVTRHCKGAMKQRYLTEGGEQEIKVIPEGDVYRLIIRSKLPKAEEFEKWVFDEVLPSIRQTGNYISEANQYSIQDIVKETICQVVPIIIQELEDKAERTKQAEREFEKLEIKVKKKIERLMYSGKHTYSDISKILATDGIELSPATICFYAESMGIMD